MERHHALVVASGVEGALSNLAGRTRQQTRQIDRSELEGNGGITTSASPSPTQDIPAASMVFGSITAAPLSRLLAFLASDAIQPPSLRLSPRSRFLDVGSGIGQAVLHVQLRFALASCTGIEWVPDRWQAGEQTLSALRAQRDHPATVVDPRYATPALLPALDDRLDRVHFVHGRIEDHLSLVSDATHVYMFDCGFHPQTHAMLLPLLCADKARILITCLTRTRMHRVWPDVPLEDLRKRFRLLNRITLTLAGSGATRVAYVYATSIH